MGLFCRFKLITGYSCSPFFNPNWTKQQKNFTPQVSLCTKCAALESKNLKIALK